MIFTERPADFNPQFEVSGCFFEWNGQTLFLLRQHFKPQGSTWGLPGGKSNPGEDPKKAALREVEEETKQILNESDLTHVGSVSVKYNDGTNFIYHMYQATFVDQPKIQINQQEHLAFAWFDKNSLPTHVRLIEDLDECINLVYPN